MSASEPKSARVSETALNHRTDHKDCESCRVSTEFETLFDIGKTITSDLDFDLMIAHLEKGIKRLVDADAVLFVLTDSNNELEIIGGADLKRRSPIVNHQDLCADVAADVAVSGKSKCHECVPNSSLCRFLPMAREDGGQHHVASVPLLRKGKAIGSITALKQNRDKFSQADLQLMEMFASIAANAVDNSLNYEKERRIARILQTSLLPKHQFSIPGFDVGSSFKSATEGLKIGGDLYDVIDLDSRHYGIMIADVSGKGVDAAVHTAMVKYMSRGLLLSKADLPAVFRKLNQAVCQELPDDVFITFFLGILDTEEKVLHYANAGHEYPLLYSKKRDRCVACKGSDGALGVLPQSNYKFKQVKFEPGDMLVLFTDGVTEARRDTAFLGVKGLERLIVENAHLSPDEFVKQIFARVECYTRKQLQDDAALLAIKAN